MDISLFDLLGNQIKINQLPFAIGNFQNSNKIDKLSLEDTNLIKIFQIKNLINL